MTPRRRSVLNSSCAVTALLSFPAVLSVGIMLAGPVQAQTTISSNKSSTVTLNNSTNYPNGNPFTITNGTTVSTSSGEGIYGSDASNWSLTNHGTVSSAAASGIYLYGSGSINNTGSISGSTSPGFFGVSVNYGDQSGSGATIVNSGHIFGASGVGLYYGGAVTNSAGGTISGNFAGLFTENGSTTLTNDGSIGGTTYGADLQDGGTISNQSGGIISGTTGVYMTGLASSINNAGTIQGNGDNGVGAYLNVGGTVTNQTGGLITGSKYALKSDASGVSVNNSGSITAGIVSGDYGIDLLGAGGTVTNNASIHGNVAVYSYSGEIDNTAGSISGTAIGVEFGSTAGSYLKVTGGAITANGGTTGVGALFLESGSIYNNGTITGTAHGVELQSGGTLFNQDGGSISGANGVYLESAGSVSNAGTIRGTSASGVYLNSGGTVTNASGGLITGSTSGVLISGARGTVDNSGSIGGALYGVHVADGGTVSNTGGTITGGTDGVILSGNTTGSVLNTGSIHGGDVGVQLSGGGYISNSSTGSITGDSLGIYTNDGFSTIHNSGYIHGNNGMQLNSGGTVDNTTLAVISGTDDGINVFNGAGSITNDGSITGATLGVYLADGGTVTNQAAGVITGSLGMYIKTASGSVSNAGSIGGTLSNGVHLVAGGSVSNTGTITGANSSDAYGVLLTGGAGSIGNTGYIKGYSGAEIGDGGTISNSSAGTIAGNILGVFVASVPGTVQNNGTISATSTQSFAAAVALDGGYLSNSSTGLLMGAANGVTDNAASGTIRNFGTIEGVSGTIGNGLNFTQYGSIYNGGLISGTNDGVLFKGGGTISNDGSILGGNAGISIGTVGALVHNESADVAGYISGSIYGVLITSENGSVINAGTIIGNNTNSISAYAVRMTNGGNVTNSASGSIMASSEGVNISGGAGILDNSGMIDAFGTSSGVSGVLLLGGGYVHNAGTNATIFGGGAGVAFADVAGTLNNAGSIGGGVYGVSFGSAGGSLNNTGLITGGTDGVFLQSSSTSFTNAGTIIGSTSSGVYLTLGGTVTNSVGGYIAGPARGVYILDGGTVINAGTIRNGTGTTTVSSPPSVGPDITPLADYNRPFGVMIQGGGAITNSAGGYIEGDSVAIGIYGNSLTTAYVTNAASATIHGGRDGVNLYAGSNTLLNAGTITAGLYGVDLGSGNVTNAASGLISAAYDGVYLNTPGTLDNSGRILQTGVGPSYAAVYLVQGGYVHNRLGGTIVGASHGIYSSAASNLTVANYGTIGASYANQPTVGILVGEGGNATINNSITGVIYSNGYAAIGAYDGNLTVNNSGTIASSDFGIRQSAVSYGGMTVTNFGDITASAAAIFGYAGSIDNQGTIESANENGIDLVTGSILNRGLISGGQQGIYVAGNGGNATIQNDFGTIEGLDGAGILLGSGGQVYNSGSATITGKYNGIFVDSGSATVTSYGQISGTKASGIALLGGGTVNNRYNTFLGTGTISGKYDGVYANNAAATVNNEGLIYATKYDGVQLYAGGTVSNLYNTVSGGQIIGNYDGVAIGRSGTPSIGSVLNHGTITGSFGNGVVIYGAGHVYNYSDGTIFGGHAGINLYGDTASLSNKGTITGGYFGSGVRLAYGAQATNSGYIQGGNRGAGVYISNGGTLFNTRYGKIYGEYGVRAINGGPDIVNSVYNLGTMSGNKVGVVLYSGMVKNGGNAIYAGTIYGGQIGVSIVGYGRVNNVGSITGESGSGISFTGAGYVYNGISNGATGVITGAISGIAASQNQVSILNAGTISGFEDGVSLLTGGYVQNRGQIIGLNDVGIYARFGYVLNLASGTITSNNTGVKMWSPFATATNAGSISGGRYGVAFGYGGRVDNVNTGTIYGHQVGVYTGYENNTASNFGTVINAGAIESAFVGVELAGLGTQSGSGFVQNSGTISGTVSYGVFSHHGGSVNNLAGGTISSNNVGISIQGASGTVNNAGVISGTNGFGLYLGYGGAVSNLSTGTISGNFYGVLVGYHYNTRSSLGTVINAGTIEASGTSVAMFGRGTGTGSGLVVNTGTIVQLGDGFDTGIYLGNGGTISNEAGGFIDTYEGIDTRGGPATLMNAGAIAGEKAVNFENGGTVANQMYGTIGGGVGVAISNGAALVTNAPTSEIIGFIDGVELGNSLETVATPGMVVNGGYIVGFQYAVGLFDPGTVINYGSILQTYNTLTLGAAISLNNGGVIDNRAEGVITGESLGVTFANAPGTLLNAGLITGSYGTGAVLSHGGYVGNSGTITGAVGGLVFGYDADSGTNAGTVQNSGLITGGTYGLWLHDGGTVVNAAAGTISGAAYALRTDGAAEVMNAGLLTASAGPAVTLNAGGTLTNTGSIGGSTDGIDGAGVVVNAGEISGATGSGVALSGGLLTNDAGGTISGGTDGVTAGSGSSIMNAGLIMDAAAPTHAGVVLSGDAALSNFSTGTISGETGVLIEGNGASLVDAGTIIGTGGQAITLDPNADPAQITLTTGAKLTGDIDGGGTDGQITLTGHNTIGNTITDFGAGSGLTVANGASWAATGNWTIATVTNDGTFQPGILGTPLRLTGNFVQTPGATLQVVVTPTVSSQFIITGKATLAGDLSYEFAPGTYSPHTYNFLSASGGQTGSFSGATYGGSVPVFLTHGTSLVTDAAHLNLDKVIYPGDDSLLGDSAEASAQAAQQAGDGLLDHAAGGGGGTNAAACAAESGVTPAATSPYGTSTASRLASAIGNAFCGAGGWIEATGSAMTLDGNGDAAGYTADQGGFMAGVDHAVNQSGTRIGLAIGYDEDWLNDTAGGKATVDTTRLGIYAAQNLGQITLTGDFMLGLANNTTTRPTGVGNAKASFGSTDYSGGFQAQTQYDVRGVTIRPAAGLRIASVSNGGFAENGSGYVPEFAVSGEGSTDTSVQPYAKVSVSKNFYTPSMTLITPSLTLGYDYEAGTTGQKIAITARDGTRFTTFQNNLSPSTAEIGAGISAGKGNWSLFAKYSAYLSGNWTSQIGEAGFTMKF